MARILFLSFLVVAAAILVDVRPADAAVISRNNPYRSFNISGVNYASTHWEKSRSKSTKPWSSSRQGGLFRRR